MVDENKQSKGGKARADKLSKEARSRIAAEGGKARAIAAAALPKVEYPGVLELGEAKIPCAVLSDGRRVLTESGITYAILGERSGASKRLKRASQEAGALLPLFIAPGQLKPFIDSALMDGPLQPIHYQDGRRNVTGYDARILRAVCEIWLRAREAKALQKQQLDKAQRAETLIRALADVGLIALVDEATGYQEKRDRDDLHKLLSVYLVEERLAWAKRFPDEFYKQVYRLNGWPWPVGKAKTPYLGHITNDVVYDRLPEGVLPKLRELNPTQDDTKRRRFKHHQFLSKEIGQPDLRDHILQILPIMRISKDWKAFKRHLDIAFPKNGGQTAMDLGEDD